MDNIWFFTRNKVKYFLYTAKSKGIREQGKWLLDYFDGITLTLHEQKDIVDFIKLNKALSEIDVIMNTLRLHVFDNLLMSLPSNINLSRWNVKQTHWIKDCPLPKDETLFILKEPFK